MVQSYGRLDTIGCFATVYIVSFPRGVAFFYECWLKMWFQLFTGFVLIVAVFTTLDAESICFLTVVGIHLHLFNSSSLLVYFLCTLRSGGGGCDNPSGFTIAG